MQNNEKTILMNTISRQVRTPMNGILSMAEMLLKTDLTIEQQNYAQTIRVSAESLLNSLNELLEWSKIQSGIFKLNKSEYNIRLLIEDILELFQERAEQKGLILYLNFLADPHVNVIVDIDKLKLIIMHLIDNSLRYTPHGHIAITVNAEELNNGCINYTFSVKDTGIGMSFEQSQKLLNLPVVEDLAIKQDNFAYFGHNENDGIHGLQICKQLVISMNGKVGLNSEFGKGSEFYFEIPIEKAIVPRKKLITSDNKTLAGIKVLMIVHDENERKALATFLDSLNVSVASAGTFGEGFSILTAPSRRQPPYDYVIIDQNIPDLNDALLLRKNSQDTPLSQVRWLVLVNGRERHREDYYTNTLGFKAVVSRPICQNKFFSTLVKVSGYLNDPSLTDVVGKMAFDVDQLPRDFKILVAEDNLINQKVLITLIDNLGIPCDLATNGRECIELSQVNNYSMILMDCVLPDIDGTEVTKLIRQREEESAQTKRSVIIALTANSLEQDREYCLANGMNDYLVKPLHADDLEKVIYKWILNPNQEDNYSDHALEIYSYPIGDEVLLDLDYLLTLYQNNIDLVKELIDIYIETTQNTLNSLYEGIESRQKNAERIAHDLKGASSYIRAFPMQESAREIETAIKAQNWLGAEHHWRLAREKFIQTMHYVSERIKHYKK